MKNFLKVTSFLVGYFGYALLAVTVFVALGDKWYASLVYSVATIGGFGFAALLRDNNTCPCCKKDDSSK